MTHDGSLAARIERYFSAEEVAFESKRMMGGICFMVADKMCIGTAKHLLMVRFDPARHEEMLARPGARPMDFTGRLMRGYVFVEPAALSDDATLATWLEIALAYNPKAKRSKGRRNAPRKRRRDQ